MGGPFSSYRAQDGPRGERTHLTPTTQKPNMIIIIIKDPQRGEMEIKEGDETGSQGRRFHTVSCEIYFRIYQFKDLITNRRV